MNNLKSSIFNINLDVDEQHYIYNTSSNTLIQCIFHLSSALFPGIQST